MMKAKAFLLPALAIAATGCGLPGLKDPVARFPTKVYSAAFAVRPGQRLARGELLDRLRRLRYEASGSASKAGRYRAEGDVFDVYLRGFAHPLHGESPEAVRIVLEDGAVREVVGPGEVRRAEARLEPELLYEISGPQRVRREPSEFGQLPRHLLDAIVAVEDRRFYRHYGVDLRGLLRAAWRDVKAGKLVEGGSTITQQLARNLYLHPRRTFSRKAREMLIAMALETRYSKDEILQLYLDQVYFGQDGPVSVCGIQAAARFFFDKTPDKLSLGESALIAGLLASPYRFNPFRDPDRALARRRTVLETMRLQGFITDSEERRARVEPLRITKSGHRPGRPADFFVAAVQEELETRYANDALITYGLTIHTTLDPRLQERAQRAVSKAKYEAALVALEPRTGAVLALVGGKDFAASPFNRAVSALRQPGSAFKPFVYGAALRGGPGGAPRWTAASLVPDEATSYQAEGSTWTPRNFDGLYRGTTSVRQAVALSLNAPAVHVTATLGVRRVIEFARELGIRSELRPNLGLALGDSELSLLELTGAYAPFANGGFKAEPFTVEAVVSREGEVLEYRKPGDLRALSLEESWLMTELLREAVRRGTARSLDRWGLAGAAAGKTGTTNWGKDAWFVGYVPGLLAGTWTGQDKPARSGMTGASHALPIWADFVSSVAAFPKDAPDPWPVPPTVLGLTVDPASGERARSGCPQRLGEYFLAGTEPKTDCPLHAGGVVGWFKRIFQK